MNRFLGFWLLGIQSTAGRAPPFSRTTVTPTRIDSCQRITISSLAREYEGLPHQVLAVASMESFQRLDGKRFRSCHFSTFIWAEHIFGGENSLYFQPHLSVPPVFLPCTGGSMVPVPDTAESIPTSGLWIWGELVVLGASQSRSSL